MIIDAYTHMTHRSYLDYLEKTGGADAKRRIARMRETAKRIPSVDVGRRLEQLNRNNIDFQVIVPEAGGNLQANDAAGRLALARVVNDGMAKLMEESKGKLIAGGTVPMTGFERGGRKEMDRAIKTLGLKAMTVPSHFKGKPLDAPEFEPLLAEAAELGIPIYIHPASPEKHRDRPYEGEYDLSHNFGWPFATILALSRLVFTGIMERYPTLKVVGHHLGGGMPFWWGRTNESYFPDNPAHYAMNESILKRLSKPLFHYFSLFYYDTAVGGSAAAVRCAYDVFGADHIIFGTDAPHGPGTGEDRLKTYPEAIKSLKLPEAATKKILADNARKMLNLK